MPQCAEVNFCQVNKRATVVFDSCGKRGPPRYGIGTQYTGAGLENVEAMCGLFFFFGGRIVTLLFYLEQCHHGHRVPPFIGQFDHLKTR